MATGFTLTFTGDQEVPPNGTTASGAGTVAWDSDARAATYEFTVTGVDFGPVLGMEPQTETTADDVTIMHVHNAERGANGPVVFGQIGPAQDSDDLSIVLNEDGSWTVSGVWEATDPANVSITEFAGKLDLAFAELEVPLYSNIHTTTFPGGEIRAQWKAEPGEVDWNAVAAVVQANFEATGEWFYL
jgi:serralysin